MACGATLFVCTFRRRTHVSEREIERLTLMQSEGTFAGTCLAKNDTIERYFGRHVHTACFGTRNRDVAAQGPYSMF